MDQQRVTGFEFLQFPDPPALNKKKNKLNKKKKKT